MQNGPKRALWILGLGLLLLATGLAMRFYLDNTPPGGPFGTIISHGEADIGGPFTLIDQHGQMRSDQDFAGSYMLIYFGYTFCPDYCPRSLAAMTGALEQLEQSDPEKAAAVVPLFITLDPERDDVAALRSYASFFHPRLVALTGSAEQVAVAARGYRISYGRVEDNTTSDYLLNHTTYVYLMDPQGRYVTHYTAEATPQEIAVDLVRRITLN